MTDAHQNRDGGPANPADLRPSPSAADMADALRSGVAVRRRHEAATPGGADAARLAALGDLEGLGPVAKAGAAAPVVRFGRQLLQLFLRPWLAMQTIFNLEIGRRFDESATIVRDLRRRVPLIEDGLQSLDTRLRALEAVRPGGEDVVRRPHTDSSYVQRLFIHSRLPPPPARVLLQGDAGDVIERELVSLGYRVTRSVSGDVDAVVARIDGRSGVAMDEGVLPLFGVMEAVGDAGMVVLLLEAPGGGSVALNNRLSEIAASRHWQVRETLVTADAGWRAVPHPPDDAVVIAMMLVRDRRSDVSDR